MILEIAFNVKRVQSLERKYSVKRGGKPEMQLG